MNKHIVVIGGGFAGINLAQHLAGKAGFVVTIVDQHNYNSFQPLLYQVATGFLETSNITYPFRKLFQDQSNIRFRMGTLEEVVPAENKVILSSGELSYDYLVMATGTETNFFGNENIKRCSLPMKTVNDAVKMRNYLLQKLEEATIETDPVAKKKRTTVVIAGGGPTGVEIAGMLAEMRKNIIRKDYPELSGSSGAIYLVDGGPKVLAPMSEKSQQYTHDKLVEMGVEVKLNKLVKDYINDTVIFTDGETITTKILIWAAGVTALVFEGIPRECYGRGRRLLVDEYNKVKGLSNVYALGDTCLQTTDKAFPEGHPQVAQVAIQQGKNLAKNLLALQQNGQQKPFTYNDKGSMAIIGRNKAVVDLPSKAHFKGFLAWFMWLFIHLVSLINARNRFKTLYNWMVAYFTKDQSLRLIIRPYGNGEEKAEVDTPRKEAAPAPAVLAGK
ncbi:NAD(P)/FAD-dependent oxidoreductase [Paraflavisolibacter sp. H34]|uniref:NAD(P)/FAD-dependent oxidoreductase n=1 Tax=Huijunlia imazamoxiresistens TaxID=3127457 RepID=UPI00301B041A